METGKALSCSITGGCGATAPIVTPLTLTPSTVSLPLVTVCFAVGLLMELSSKYYFYCGTF